MSVKSSLLSGVPGLVHGFGTRLSPIPQEVAQAWSTGAPKWKQVHGTRVVEVTAPGHDCGETDALFTMRVNQPVGVVTADCVPILLARRAGGAIAAVHAGWRGTQARILRSLWKELRARGENPADWVAAIGPAIGPCCYEVSEELADSFVRDFRLMKPESVTPKHRMLDLPAINAMELQLIGVGEIDLLRSCTRCTGGAATPQFHSYRREGSGTRQYSVLFYSK